MAPNKSQTNAKGKMWSEKNWVKLAVIIAIASQSYAQCQFKDTIGYRKNETVQQTWPYSTENINTSLRNVANSSQIMFEGILANSMKNFLPFSHVNTNCVRDGLHYIEGLQSQTLWAIKMYESSAKYPSGTLELGNFDLCMSASSEPLGIRGAYALVQMHIRRVDEDVVHQAPGPVGRELSEATTATVNEQRTRMPVSSVDILWALCFPDSCSGEDVEKSVRHALISDLGKKYRIAVDINVPPYTYTSDQTSMPVVGVPLFVCGVIALTLALVMVGTAYESKLQPPETKTLFGRTILAFSVTRNFKNLMKCSENDEFSTVNGGKVVAMIALVIGHRLIVELGIPSRNNEYSDHFYHSFWASFLKSPVSVEIFFLLSGFFMFIKVDKDLRNGKPFNFKLLLSQRMARILPSYITIIVIYAYFLPYLGDGPFWKLVVHREAEYCQKNWWTNLLFINNYVNSTDMCLFNSWYLACDMHFFIVGVILTYIIWRWKRFGTGIFGMLFTASIYIPAKYIYDNKYWGVLPFTYRNMTSHWDDEHVQNIYIKSHHRFTIYLIGMASAYIYLQIKNSKLKFSLISRIIGFTMSALLIIVCHIVTSYFYIPDQTYNPWHHLFYFTFQRMIFSVTCSYLLVVSSLSNFGFFNSFLDFKFFVILAKMSYVVNFVHVIVQLQSVGQIRHQFYKNSWSLFWRLDGDITTALLYSLPIVLFVEVPYKIIFQQLAVDIFSKNKREKPNSNVHQRTNGQINKEHSS